MCLIWICVVCICLIYDTCLFLICVMCLLLFCVMCVFLICVMCIFDHVWSHVRSTGHRPCLPILDHTWSPTIATHFGHLHSRAFLDATHRSYVVICCNTLSHVSYVIVADRVWSCVIMHEYMWPLVTKVWDDVQICQHTNNAFISAQCHHRIVVITTHGWCQTPEENFFCIHHLYVLYMLVYVYHYQIW